MSFQTGLSGLNAASQNLDVIGNNVSNSETTGYKESRAEFASIVASTIGQGNDNNTGLGVAVQATPQQFTQGTLSVTGNSLDLAINGNGFFQLTMPDGSTAYTRSGNFKLDNSGDIVTNANAKVMGFPTTTTGIPTSTTMQALTIPTGAPIPAQATSTITAQLNLPASATTVYNAATNTPPLTTYGTTVSVYDTQGNAVPFTMNFTRAASTPAAGATPALDNWDVRDSSGNTLFTMSFTANGTLYSPTTAPTVTIPSGSAVTPAISAAVTVTGVTEYATSYGVTSLNQNGYTAGSYVSMAVGDNGVITATYSNGQTQATGMVALADFQNSQGLKDVGGNNWTQTYASGQPITGEAGTGNFGAINAGTLEDSNVDITAQLVDMMTAQRDYQANAQTIKTEDQVMQTLVNLG